MTGPAVAAPSRLPREDGSPVAGTHGAAPAAAAASEASLVSVARTAVLRDRRQR